MENTKKRYWLVAGIVGALIFMGVCYALDNFTDNGFLNIISIPAILVGLSVYGFKDPGIGGDVIFTSYGFLVGAYLGWI